jgi:two-component system NarL family sensor kinase
VATKAVRGPGGAIACFDTVFEDVTERKRATEGLQAARRRLAVAREQERKHLAAELHDTIGQELVALKLTIQSTGGPEGPLAPTLKDASERCSQLIRDVRHISQALYPPVLQSLGLFGALRRLARYCRLSDIQCDLECPEELQAARFGSEVEIAVFRIAQEAVNNALRHSGAENIRIHLREDDGRIELGVSDDGCGFDPDASLGQGLGLTTMRDRAEAAGGTLHIASQPGRTCVTALVPSAGAGSGDEGGE